MPNDEANMRVRVPRSLADRWDKMLEARNISAQKAFVALMDWICGEDDLTQSMILGQVSKADRPEVSAIVLNRLAKGEQGGKKRTG